jgi:hypothetical protein
MREQQIPELRGTSILTSSFFNKLIRRIESIKPLAGDGIQIKEQENGFEIIRIASGGSEDYSAITLNVCSNGVPAEILVLGVPVEE